MPSNHSLLINKQNLYQVKHTEQDMRALEEGEILFKIHQYALTTNNITYAVSGFTLKYWDFFPVDETWGSVPVWGFGEVVESKNDSIQVGERCYGYFPMSDYLVVQPGRINPFGFSDIAEHRKELSPIYNFYARLAADPSFQEKTKDYIPIIKPLFATSFLIYYFLKEEHFFDSEQLIITSASSKTGLALAYMLQQNQATDNKKIIGLTSPRNVEFVTSTGYYDEVLTYDDYKNIPDIAASIVDFAGSTQLLHEVSDSLKDNLKHIVLVGLTDWKAYQGFKDFAKSKFFFAPKHIKNRYAEWGVEKTNILLNKALYSFIEAIKTSIEIMPVRGHKAVANLYLEMLDGKVDPKKGYSVLNER